MKAISLVSIILLLYASSAHGHVDDEGDIHPRVTVENDRFVVYFRNSESGEAFRETLGHDGKLIEARTAVPSGAVDRIYHDEMVNIKLPNPNALYVIPRRSWTQERKPYLLKSKGGEETKIELNWGENVVSKVHGASIADNSFVFTVSQRQLQDFDGPSPFYFVSYDRTYDTVAHVRAIGEPDRVYDFPLASKVLSSGVFAYVAWMKIEDEEIVLMLSRFNSKTGMLESERISTGHGNSAPSIGMIGDHILIAFHLPEELISYFGKDSKIVYHHCLISDLFHVRSQEE